MRRELELALWNDFPLLYRDKSTLITVSLMAFGFECGDGWEPLLRELSAKLEPLIAAVGASIATDGVCSLPCIWCNHPQATHDAGRWITGRWSADGSLVNYSKITFGGRYDVLLVANY
jgi:hypothetical protein